MEKNRVSEAPNHGQNHGEIVDFKDVIQSFGSFKLGKDGYLVPATAAPQITNADVSNSKKFKNQCNVVEEASGKDLGLPENSVLDNGGFWGHNFLTTQGQNHEQEKESLRGSQDFVDYYFDLFKHTQESVGVESSSKEAKMDGYPSDFRLQPLFEDENFEFDQVVHSGVGYGSSRIKSSSSAEAEGGGCLFDLSLLQEILDGGDGVEINTLLLTLQGSYFDLMTDKSLSVVFQKLVSVCKGDQLDFVVADILPFIINAAFCKTGAISIIRLIRRLKKSNHAISIAQILSTQFVAIMTHEIARLVIQNCFIYFPNRHNKILYERAILDCKELATDKVGCISLNELINTIGGEQRSRLLNHIADCSSYLSNHQYGNYVVQKVLSLKNDGISARIVLGIRGQFVKLAEHPGGSHVVEKCLEASDFGIVSVVQEIVEAPKACFQLSKNQFGNYVIQAALNKTKERGFSNLYKSLVKSLEPYIKELNQTMSGKIVASLINDEVGLKWRSFSNRKESGIWRMVANKERVV